MDLRRMSLHEERDGPQDWWMVEYRGVNYLMNLVSIGMAVFFLKECTGFELFGPDTRVVRCDCDDNSSSRDFAKCEDDSPECFIPVNLKDGEEMKIWINEY